MKTQLTRLMAIMLVFCFGVLQPASGIVDSLRTPSPTKLISQAVLYTDQAVCPPLVEPIAPIFNRAKIRLTVAYHIWAPKAASAAAWLLPSMAMIPALATVLGTLHGMPLMYAMVAPRLDWMKRDFKKIEPQHDVWESVRAFLFRYFGSSVTLADNAEHLHEQIALEEIDRAFMLWLTNERQSDPSLNVPASVLEIQLHTLRYPGQRRDISSALSQLKQANARKELLDVALRSGLDYISVAGALDALTDLHAEDEIHEFMFSNKFTHFLPSRTINSRVANEDRLSEVAAIPFILPILARLQIPQAKYYFEYKDALTTLQRKFDLPNTRLAQTALRLLAFEDIPRKQALALLFALIDKNDRLLKSGEISKRQIPAPNDLELYVMVTMLAILQVFHQSEAGRTALRNIDFRWLNWMKRAITRTHWNAPEHDLAQNQEDPTRIVTVSKIAGRLGEMVEHDIADPAVRVFMGFLFEMVVRDALHLIVPGMPAHPGIQSIREIAVTRNRNSRIENPRHAARMQFSVLAHAAAQPKGIIFRWPQVYKFALLKLEQGRVSLSELASEIVVAFIREKIPANFIREHTQTRAQDKESGTMIFILPSMAPVTGSEHEALYPSIDKPVHQVTEFELRKIWEQILKTLFSPDLLNLSYTRALVYEWEPIVQLIYGQEPTRAIRPYHIEMDPTHICNDKCNWCKFELRDVPMKELSLKERDMLRLIKDGIILNSHMSQKTSGVIGDPTMNRGTLAAIKKMNEVRMHSIFTTNGRLVSEQLVNELINKDSVVDAVSVSLDAAREQTYIDTKHPKGEGADAPVAQVLDTLHRLRQRRNATGGKTKIIVSYLIQESNYEEMEDIIPVLKALGVDAFQIKFQHYDPRSQMQPEHIAYIFDRQARYEAYGDANFKVVFMQDEQLAHAKNTGVYGVNHIAQLRRGENIIMRPAKWSLISPLVQYCIIQFIGPAVAATGMWHPCCESYKVQGEERTFPVIGDAVTEGYRPLLENQLQRFRQNPHVFCRECPVTGRFYNEVVGWMVVASEYPGMLAEWGRMLRARYNFEERLARDREWLENENRKEEEEGDGSKSKLTIALFLELGDRGAAWLRSRRMTRGARIWLRSVNGLAVLGESLLTPIPFLLPIWVMLHKKEHRRFASESIPTFIVATIGGIEAGIAVTHVMSGEDPRWLILATTFVFHAVWHTVINRQRSRGTEPFIFRPARLARRLAAAA
jgi:wyosine [tRNA(Phe)-imidazoG37] synthetase (radical SAM superfamily)